MISHLRVTAFMALVGLMMASSRKTSYPMQNTHTYSIFIVNKEYKVHLLLSQHTTQHTCIKKKQVM